MKHTSWKDRKVYTCTNCGMEHEQHPERCKGCFGKAYPPYFEGDRVVEIERRKPVHR